MSGDLKYVSNRERQVKERIYSGPDYSIDPAEVHLYLIKHYDGEEKRYSNSMITLYVLEPPYEITWNGPWAKELPFGDIGTVFVDFDIAQATLVRSWSGFWLPHNKEWVSNDELSLYTVSLVTYKGLYWFGYSEDTFHPIGPFGGDPAKEQLLYNYMEGDLSDIITNSYESYERLKRFETQELDLYSVPVVEWTGNLAHETVNPDILYSSQLSIFRHISVSDGEKNVKNLMVFEYDSECTDVYPIRILDGNFVISTAIRDNPGRLVTTLGKGIIFRYNDLYYCRFFRWENAQDIEYKVYCLRNYKQWSTHLTTDLWTSSIPWHAMTHKYQSKIYTTRYWSKIIKKTNDSNVKKIVWTEVVPKMKTKLHTENWYVLRICPDMYNVVGSLELLNEFANVKLSPKIQYCFRHRPNVLSIATPSLYIEGIEEYDEDASDFRTYVPTALPVGMANFNHAPFQFGDENTSYDEQSDSD